MEITYTKGPIGAVEADVLVVPLYASEDGGRAPLRELDTALGGRLADALSRGEVRGKLYETTPWPASGISARIVLFVGAGERAEADADRMRNVFGTAARQVRHKFGSVALALRSDAHARHAVEGFLLGAFEPDLLKSERTATKTEKLTVVAGRNVRADINLSRAVADATNLARELVTLPPNGLTPTILAERAEADLGAVGVTVEVLKGRQLEPFGGLLAVAKGSAEPPVMISMSWEPAKARKEPVLGLVGKGVTFDSGGLSLKPSDGMSWMKGDMAGAAAVIGAMHAIASLNVPLTVRAAVPATENMPSGTATRVGDVVRMYSGKTAEILNTDAEGRLILHDALAWLAEKGITHMVDAATLTGAMMVALGHVTTGVMGRPDAWVNKVVASARRAGERAWPLPLYPDYREQLRSDIADMKNVGGRPAGSITAGWFLAEAVPDEVQWAHLDVAGTAWTDGKPYRASGASGAGVAAFVQLAQDLATRKR